MKRLVVTTVLAALCVTMMTGCGAFIAFGGGGSLYQDTKVPMNNVAYWGPSTNSVMKKAMQQGGITKIHHIDQEVTNVLGIIATYKIIVYGE
jgi:hypothetical protein